MSRHQVVGEIRRLHQLRQPLNLTAVKRRWPQLLKSACETVPYWGWKQAIEDAGLDYGDLMVELEPKVTCLVCKASLENLAAHLISKHGLTTDDYREQFPGADLSSESFRARQSRHLRKRKRRDIPEQLADWEPLPSAEYVLDRLAEYHKHRVALHCTNMARIDKATVNLAIHYFGNWDHALRRLGLDPSGIRRNPPGRSLSENDIVARLKDRQAKGLGVNDAAVMREDLQLYNAGRRRFGTHNRALRAAGIDPRSVRKRMARIPDEDKRLAVQAVREIAALKGRERYKAVCNLYKDFSYVAYSPTFGCWKKVARAAGVPEHVVSKRLYNEKDAVVEALLERGGKGRSLRPVDIFHENRSLYTAVLKFFGDFKRLRLAMLETSDAHRARLWDQLMAS